MATDKHHFFHTRREWTAKAEFVRALRSHAYCVVTLNVQLHRFIHKENPCGVPLPTDRAAEIILYRLNVLWEMGVISEKDKVKRRLQVLINVSDGVPGAWGMVTALKGQLEAVNKFYGPFK